MKTYSPRLLLEEGIVFPEGPRWHEGRLWFSDMHAHRIRAVDTKGKAELMAELDDRPSGLGWLPDGGLLVVRFRERDLVLQTKQGAKPYADLAPLASGFINDMVVDGKGRAYVGNFGYDRHKGEPPRTTCLVRVDPDGRVTRAAEDLFFPNGSVITADGRALIIGETQAHRLTAFDLAPDGTLSNRRVWASLDERVFPDGMCLDAEGAIWVSDARGPALLRVREGGTVDRTVSTGTRYAFACMLGGADRRTLFACTSTGSGPAMADKRDGAIETVRVDVPGAGLP